MSCGNFDCSLKFTLNWEGGYSKDKNDTGNYYKRVFYGSNFGITPCDIADWFGPRYASLLTVDFMKNIPQNVVYAIYLTRYWNAVGSESLPAGIDLVVYDFGVNAGVYSSSLVLQQLLGFTGHDLDGAIGMQTLGAVWAVNDHEELIEKLTRAQEEHYRELVQFPLYGAGWLNRTQERRKTGLALM